MRLFRTVALFALLGCVSATMAQEENIKSMFDKVTSNRELVKSQSHDKTFNAAGDKQISETHVYYLQLEKDSPVVDALKNAFRKAAPGSLKEFQGVAGAPSSVRMPVSVSSGDLKVVIGTDQDADYTAMTFPADSAADKSFRNAYAMEWKTEKDNSVSLILVVDKRFVPKKTEQTKKELEETYEWVYHFQMLVDNVRYYKNKINKGEQTYFPTKILKMSKDCSMLSPGECEICAKELREVAGLITKNFEKNLLLEAVKNIENAAKR